MDNAIESARKKGYVETILGRRRYLRDINSANATVRGFAERNAINAPIQGSAADMIKVAMINIHSDIKKKKMKSRMLLQVHDELVFDAHVDEVEDLKKLVNHRIARWDGVNWSAVGVGTDSIVQCLEVYNSDLYVGGIFSLAGGNNCNKIAKWNNSVGIKEEENLKNVYTYPNPCSGKLFIKNSEALKIISQNIFSVEGMELLAPEPNAAELDLSNLSDGIYFLKTQTSEGILTKKIVIQR